MSSQAPTQGKQRWYKQIAETYSFTSEQVSSLGLKLLGIFLGSWGVALAIGFATGFKVLFGVLGFTTALLITLIWFGKVAERAAYSSIEGQPGAGAAVLQAMRGPWFSAVGIGVDRQQNLVHRVVGKPGIILVGEGERPGQLVGEQKRAHARVIPNIPVHEIIVGQNGVTIYNLQKTIKKLKKELRPAEVTEVRKRLDAMPKNALPLPKGPLPMGRKIARR